jgi:pilus assembly protein FimV
VAAPDSYRVAAGDTTSRIADRVRAEGVTASQAMIALQRANPSAFANNNINQLKRGQVLRVPSEAQMREVSAQEAVASVREQTAAWQATTAKVAVAPKPALEAAQVDATAKAPAPAPAPAPVSKPEMKLLGTQTGKAGAAAAGKEQGAATKPEDTRKLAQVKNLTESAKAEKQKLAGKVETLDAQIKANDKKVELQNARMAELESQVREQQARAEAAKAAKAPVPEAPKPADAAPAVAATPGTTDAASDAAAPAAPAKPAAAPKPKPVVVEEAPAEEGSLVPMLAGGVAALLAILGGGYWWNQRRRREQDEAEATLAELEGLEPEDSGFAAASADDGLDDSWLNEPAAAPAAAADRVLADPLEEAEQYIAYERYPQAVGLLTKAIAASPDRADLRMKLLEVYAHLDDWNGFVAQETWFEHAGDLGALSRAEELKAGMTPPAAGSSSVAQGDDFLDFGTAPAATDDSLPSLEDLEMDFNSSVNASSPALDTVKDDDLGLDFAAFESSPAPAAKADALDDLSFELDNDVFADQAPAVAADEGLDFALDDEPASAAGGGKSLGDLVDLDSEMDFMPASPASAPAAAPVEDDLSFSLDDLEVADTPVSASEVSLEEDFNLDAPAPAAADDLAFAELDGADLSDGDFGTGAGEFSLDEADTANTSLDDIAADFDSTMKLEPEAPAAAAAPAMADAGADLGMDDEFDFLADTDENATKLDLARAYIDMGDMEGARDILQEVLSEGNAPQKDEAKGLLAQVG